MKLHHVREDDHIKSEKKKPVNYFNYISGCFL